MYGGDSGCDNGIGTLDVVDDGEVGGDGGGVGGGRDCYYYTLLSLVEHI